MQEEGEAGTAMWAAGWGARQLLRATTSPRLHKRDDPDPTLPWRWCGLAASASPKLLWCFYCKHQKEEKTPKSRELTSNPSTVQNQF